MTGPVSLDEVCALLLANKTTKVWKASKEGEDLRFYRMPLRLILSSQRQTDHVGQPK
jgi:hypothetical protein